MLSIQNSYNTSIPLLYLPIPTWEFIRESYIRIFHKYKTIKSSLMIQLNIILLYEYVRYLYDVLAQSAFSSRQHNVPPIEWGDRRNDVSAKFSTLLSSLWLTATATAFVQMNRHRHRWAQPSRPLQQGVGKRVVN